MTDDHEFQAALTPQAGEIFGGLWAALFDRPDAPRLVMLTAAGRQEGVSTIACGLALAGGAPRYGRNGGQAAVALVDMNLRNPSLHRLLDVEHAPGVREIITQGTEPADVAQRVTDQLDVYVAGAARGLAVDIVRSKAVGALFATLKQYYDHIIVDAGAVNEAPDVQALAAVIGQVVLVANTQRTPREAVIQARRHIEAVNANVIGSVLNMRVFPIPSFLYRRV